MRNNLVNSISTIQYSITTNLAVLLPNGNIQNLTKTYYVPMFGINVDVDDYDAIERFINSNRQTAKDTGWVFLLHLTTNGYIVELALATNDKTVAGTSAYANESMVYYIDADMNVDEYTSESSVFGKVYEHYTPNIVVIELARQARLEVIKMTNVLLS